VKPETASGDRGFEAGVFLRALEEDLDITPHVPISAERVTSPAPAAEAHPRMLRRMETKGYALSQRARKKIERMFGWMKQAVGLREVRHVGRWKTQQVAYLWAAAFNPLRLAHLEAARWAEGRRGSAAKGQNRNTRSLVPHLLSLRPLPPPHPHLKNHPFCSILLGLRALPSSPSADG
jgi:hypothetical protein